MSGRSPNFTTREKAFFQSLLTEYPVLSSSKTNKETNVAKKEAWEKFTVRFNARGIDRERSMQQLKFLRKNIQKKYRRINDAREKMLCDRSNTVAITEVQEYFNTELERQTEMEEDEEIILVSVLPGEEEAIDVGGLSEIGGVQFSGQLKEREFERVEEREFERVEKSEFERLKESKDCDFETLKNKLIRDQLEAVREEKIMRKEEHRLKILKYKAQLEYYDLRKKKLNSQ